MTAPREIAGWVLEQSLNGSPWTREDIDPLLNDPVLFRVLAEGLSDRFDEALVRRYAEIFAYVIARHDPRWKERDLIDRYARVRRPRAYNGASETVKDIYILSRVTLGADVAITSVILDGLKRRFRNAHLWLCGERKSYQLFEGDNRVGYYPLFYQRGEALDRVLTSAPQFKSGLVVDPDSRITQLGLLPVCPEENYFFFESRAYGGASTKTLTQLTADWVREVFGVEAKPYVSPLSKKTPGRFLALSLGVGGNPVKGLGEAFERMLCERLSASGVNVIADLGAGGEETERVTRAVLGLPNFQKHKGSFADFANVIAQSAGFIGYDSGGTHVAAVSGVPVKVFFKGFVNDRMFERWKPSGSGHITIVRIDDEAPDPAAVLRAAGL